ncbi:hypothetical protein ACH4E8_34490 [Streptomyces sp. NPDC017979]|uniref:hypothetical protein n=1 Tax=Streptomyces sp. NPDC017979 TaxID=3365024 RepID=UPI003794A3DD
MEWFREVNAADELRGPGVPLEELPGFIAGRLAVERAWRLLDDPSAPGALTESRTGLRSALALLPQSRPDQLCYEERWRSRRRYGGESLVCSRPTCGRCLPLKAALEHGSPVA